MKTITGNNKYQNPWTLEEEFTLMYCVLKTKTKASAFKKAEKMIKRTHSSIRCHFYHCTNFREKFLSILKNPEFSKLDKFLMHDGS